MSGEAVLVIDVAGETLSPEERARLASPVVAGVILFARNFSSRNQVEDLVADIRRVNPSVLVMVDQEGGRVQRFCGAGFTRLPSMRALRLYCEEQPETGADLVKDTGWLLAAELRSAGIDLALSPVLDLDRGISEVIGDRAFSGNPEQVAQLAGLLIAGMHEAGMASVGKHFPGHGGVALDSHTACPVDGRGSEEIQQDLLPFQSLLDSGGLDAVMMSHVVYTARDRHPAGFSSLWINRVLREEMGFDGALFSDCLSMEAARQAGSAQQRVGRALGAGCDAALLCNSPSDVAQVIAALEKGEIVPGLDQTVRAGRLARLRGKAERVHTRSLLESSQRRQAVRQALQESGLWQHAM
ncbi:MAG: beta-N-acetylhexosaminidase [Kistimonas sp.]|nr:beta-N-acetylhexosaminidase [Kistimonas sp.]